LIKVLEAKGKNNDQVWASIATREGSVQHLDFLDKEEKEIFKTAFEIDQKHLIELAGDRVKYICQGQSLNLFLLGNVSKKELHSLHMMAWKRGLKSLYYLRSMSVQRNDKVSHDPMSAFGENSITDISEASGCTYCAD
jgi:ribonucleoside-diphosphate reductase alpha chain